MLDLRNGLPIRWIDRLKSLPGARLAPFVINKNLQQKLKLTEPGKRRGLTSVYLISGFLIGFGSFEKKHCGNFATVLAERNIFDALDDWRFGNNLDFF